MLSTRNLTFGCRLTVFMSSNECEGSFASARLRSQATSVLSITPITSFFVIKDLLYSLYCIMYRVQLYNREYTVHVPSMSSTDQRVLILSQLAIWAVSRNARYINESCHFGKLMSSPVHPANGKPPI